MMQEGDNESHWQPSSAEVRMLSARSAARLATECFS
jgi:hypothetical protein